MYSWEEYTAKGKKGPLDGFTLNVVLGWSCWQTFAISYIRLNILLNRNRIRELWFNLNELVAPLNIPVDSKIRAIKLRWNLRLWLCTMYTICWWTMTVVEGNVFELPFWTEFLNLSLTAFGLLHIFSLHTLELFVQIINLAFDSAISTRSVKALEERTVPKKKDVFESSIHAMVQSFWKVEELVLEFNKVFHNRMVLEMSHFFIMEVLLLYFCIRNFMEKQMPIGSYAGLLGNCILFAFSVYSFCSVCSAVTAKWEVYLCELSKLAKQRGRRNNVDPLISRRVK
jgi:hypothetical protein